MNIYYVYIYRHPLSKIPFYVGYGKNNRHLSHLNEAKRDLTSKQGEHKLNTIRKILRDGLVPIIEFVGKNISKEQACELEKFLISEIGRRCLDEGPLTNLTAGGDGGFSPEAIELSKIANKNKAVVKDAMGNIFKVSIEDERYKSGELVGHNSGKIHTTETRSKLSSISSERQSCLEYRESRKNMMTEKYSDESYINYVQNKVDNYWNTVLSDPNWEHHKPFLGKSHTDETKEKQRKSALLKPKICCKICNRFISKHVLKKHIKSHNISDDEVVNLYENYIL